MTLQVKDKRGYFITIEHADGVGGTTMRDYISANLESIGFDVVRTFEPGGTEFGTEIRRILGLDGDTPWVLAKPAELLLYVADRAQHYKEVLKPALRTGKVIVCDRYLDSTLAYQGQGRGFDDGTLMGLHNLATGLLLPDLTVVIDGDSRRDLAHGDRFERDTSLQQLVRKTYLNLAERDTERYMCVDREQPIHDVYSAVLHKVQDHYNMNTQR